MTTYVVNIDEVVDLESRRAKDGAMELLGGLKARGQVAIMANRCSVAKARDLLGGLPFDSVVSPLHAMGVDAEYVGYGWQLPPDEDASTDVAPPPDAPNLMGTVHAMTDDVAPPLEE